MSCRGHVRNPACVNYCGDILNGRKLTKVEVLHDVLVKENHPYTQNDPYPVRRICVSRGLYSLQLESTHKTIPTDSSDHLPDGSDRRVSCFSAMSVTSEVVDDSTSSVLLRELILAHSEATCMIHGIWSLQRVGLS